jgi:hypothetical protein
MSNLKVSAPLAANLQPVADQGNISSALSLATNGATVRGQDVVGGMLPLTVAGQAPPTGQQTWGRLIRLAGIGTGQFYDIGVDQSGNLFLNGPNSTKTVHLITITPTGVVTIGK